MNRNEPVSERTNEQKKECPYIQMIIHDCACVLYNVGSKWTFAKALDDLKQLPKALLIYFKLQSSYCTCYTRYMSNFISALFLFLKHVSATMVKRFWKNVLSQHDWFPGGELTKKKKERKMKPALPDICAIKKVFAGMTLSSEQQAKSNVKPVICYCKTKPACIIWYWRSIMLNLWNPGQNIE